MSFQSLHKGQSVYIQDDFQAAVHRNKKTKIFLLDFLYIPDISCPLCLSY